MGFGSGKGVHKPHKHHDKHKHQKHKHHHKHVDHSSERFIQVNTYPLTILVTLGKEWPNLNSIYFFNQQICTLFNFKEIVKDYENDFF